ncbi:hypothetical protein OKW12_001046 [Pseudomonas silensiensis]|jgi:hypothetical protein|nr:hypothetical protein [Pseudomonas silensiensis]
MRVIELAFIRGVMAALLDVAQVVPVGQCRADKTAAGQKPGVCGFHY